MGLAVIAAASSPPRRHDHRSSAVGQGTTFTILMPHAPNAPARRITSAPGLPRWCRPAGHVLVVEDGPPSGASFSRLLGRLGYTTEVFDRAREALEDLPGATRRLPRGGHDLTMPGMTGDTLAVEVRKLRPTLPVVLVTGHKLVTEERLRDAGVSAVLRNR